jgi:hypothetical protein
VTSVEGFIRQRRAHVVVSGSVVVAGIYPGWLDWASHSGRAVHALVALLDAVAVALAAGGGMVNLPAVPGTRPLSASG